MSGSEADVLAKYKKLRAKGGFSQKGPRILRASERILKRGIRGMLPDFREGQGRLAFKRVRCYEGVPTEFEKKEMIKLKVQIPKKYIQLKELSERL